MPSPVAPGLRFGPMLLWAMLLTSAGLIVQFGLVSPPPLPWFLSPFARPDLALHAVAFLCLAVPAFLLFGLQARVGCCLLVAGVVLEALQLLTPARQASLPDLVADIAGIVLATGLVACLRGVVAVLRAHSPRSGLVYAASLNEPVP